MKINKGFNHPLMSNNITSDDNKQVINFLKDDPKLTNGKKVKEFEKKWSKWLGVKYSVFVNSGSSANILSLSYLRTIFPSGGEVIVPSLNWVSNINAILYAGFKPVILDVNFNNLGVSEKQIKKAINKRTVAIFITHILGFSAFSSNIFKILNNQKKKIFLIEDVCESHGAKFKNRKLGTFGSISNFSFYYAHHMTTIEGGMICTNNRNIYESLRIMRSHGMLRESTSELLKKKVYKKYNYLNKDFIFLYPGFNFRSTEINAVYGINQLKKLDLNNKKRINNFNFFLKNLNSKKYFTDFILEGSCNYAFVVIFRKNLRNSKFRKKFELTLKKYNIEFRRGTAGGGNQAMQPYLNFFKNQIIKKFKLKNINIIHKYGYYLGNFPGLEKKKVLDICQILNSINHD